MQRVPYREIARRLGVAKSTIAYHAKAIGYARCAGPKPKYNWAEIAQYVLDYGRNAALTKYTIPAATFHKAQQRGVVPYVKGNPLVGLKTQTRRGTLKRALIRVGTPNHCAICQLTTWLGKPLSLQLDHIDGNKHNNDLSNLRLLCPNCHSQTDTFAGRNIARASSSGRTTISEVV